MQKSVLFFIQIQLTLRSEEFSYNSAVLPLPPNKTTNMTPNSLNASWLEPDLFTTVSTVHYVVTEEYSSGSNYSVNSAKTLNSSEKTSPLIGFRAWVKVGQKC